tara:strand:- start:7939 stop:12681 length:4743 start_codon:yes stop_codon:yes gene_type:complete
VANNQFKGTGGGGGSSASNQEDNLFSTDAFEFVLGISEGPIGGIVGDTPEEKLQNIFVDDVPVFNSINESNFDNSSLMIRFENGTPLSAKEDAEEGQTPIWFCLGGQNITQQVSSNLAYASPVTRTTVPTTKGFDEIELRFIVSQLVKYTDEGSKNNTLSLEIAYKNILDSEWTIKNVSFTGKTTISPFVKVHNIVMPRTKPEDQFEIRVKRLSQDSTDEDIAEVNWASYELLTKTGDAYTDNGVEYDDPDLEYHPGLSMLHVAGVLGQQLTSIPTVNANYYGLECAIPSNYDPITKTYDETEVWNGQFKAKKHWTDNPFWIAYELVTNLDWGMVRYNPRVKINRYSVYRMAKYADGYDLHTDEKNLTNPITGEQQAARYTFNIVLTSPKNGWDILRYVLGSAFARPIETDLGEIKFLADLPEAPVATITPEMCVSSSGGSPYNYNFSAISERHNALTSSYIDASMDYQEQYVSEIRDEDSINKYGLNPYEFEAVGATDIWEVKRRMTFYLSSVTTETRTISFSSTLQGMAFEPMDIINIVDPVAGYAYSGRAVKLETKAITLRDPVYFDEAGVYNVTVMGTSEDYSYTTQISSSNLDQPIYRLKIQGFLPDLSQFNRYPPVVISASEEGQIIGLPKPYRILKCSENTSIKGVYDFVCQEVNLNKHVDADNLIISEAPQHSFLLKPQVRKVTNLRIVDEEHLQLRGLEQINLWVAWDIVAPLPPGGYFEIKIKEESTNGREYISKTVNQYFEIQNVKIGEVRIEVRSVQGDTQSAWTTLDWVTTMVLSADMKDQGVSPEISIKYENYTLTIESKVMYQFGELDIQQIDLLETSSVQGIQFNIHNDLDPENRPLLFTKIGKSTLQVTKSDFEIAVSGGELPSNLYITARVIDLAGGTYPNLLESPLSFLVSTPVAAITNLSYEYVDSDETPHLLTWDDNNYAYQVIIYKPDGRTIQDSYQTYSASQAFGFLKAETGYVASVAGVSSTLKYGTPTKITFNVSAPPTPEDDPTILNQEGVITLTPPKVSVNTSYYEFKYHSENVISDAADYSNGDSITLYAQRAGQSFHIWYRLSSREGFGIWRHHNVIAEKAFTPDVDEIFDGIVNKEDTPWGASLSQRLSTIAADLEVWSEQQGELGQNYSTLQYNVSGLVSENQLRALDILAIKEKVGDTSVQAQITEFKNVQIGYEDAQGNWVEGAAFAQAFSEAKILNSSGDYVTAFSYFHAIEDALGELSGRIEFAIDANGHVTGIFIDGSESASRITFQSQNTSWVDLQGNIVLGVNSSTNELEFHGSGTFSGALKSPTYEMIGDEYMKVERAAPFGPDNLRLWKGPVILGPNNEPDYANLTKSNGVAWEDEDGFEFKGGGLTLSGVLETSALRVGSGLMISDANKTAPIIVMSMANSRSNARVFRSLTSNKFVGPTYEREEGKIYDNWRLVNYKSDLWLKVLCVKDSGNDKPMTVEVKTFYTMVDTAHPAHNTWETISSISVNYSYYYGTLYMPYVYTTREEPWETLSVQVTANSTDSAGKPLSLSLEIQAFNNVSSPRTEHTITGDTYEPEDTQPTVPELPWWKDSIPSHREPD